MGKFDVSKTRTIEYWINKGLTEEEAKIKISYERKKRSIISTVHWVNKGFTEEEAKIKISKIQADRNKKKKNFRKNNPLCIEYWINKGLTEEEAKIKMHEQNKKRSVICIEYWINKGFTEAEAKIKISKIQAERSNKLGRKGGEKDPGIKFCPYILAEKITTIAEQTMAPKDALKSRYAVVEAGTYPELNYLTFTVEQDAGYKLV